MRAVPTDRGRAGSMACGGSIRFGLIYSLVNCFFISVHEIATLSFLVTFCIKTKSNVIATSGTMR